MCDVVVVSVGSGGSKSSGVEVLAAVLVGLALGLWWLARTVFGPVLLVAGVLAWRWLSGANLSGRPRAAAFLRGSSWAASPLRLDVLGLVWMHWPGYRRAVVRWALTAVVIGGCVYPLATAVVVMTGVVAGAVVWGGPVMAERINYVGGTAGRRLAGPVRRRGAAAWGVGLGAWLLVALFAYSAGLGYGAAAWVLWTVLAAAFGGPAVVTAWVLWRLVAGVSRQELAAARRSPAPPAALLAAYREVDA